MHILLISSAGLLIQAFQQMPLTDVCVSHCNDGHIFNGGGEEFNTKPARGEHCIQRLFCLNDLLQVVLCEIYSWKWLFHVNANVYLLTNYNCYRGQLLFIGMHIVYY